MRRALFVQLDATVLSRLAAEVDRLGVAAVAARCDVSVATVYRLLRGSSSSRAVARRIASGLDDLDEHRGEGALS